jgi:hypothetical protein
VTDIEIVNFALGEVGSNLITSFDDLSAEATLAKAQYKSIRDAVVISREWTFAKTRYVLAQDAVAPAFGYLYQFVLPTNVLRVLRVYDTTGLDTSTQLDDWIREGFRVLTNTLGPIYAEVLVRVDESAFAPDMAIALANRLAAEWAIPLSENRQIAADQAALAQKRLMDAAAVDGSQGRTQRMTPPPLPGRRTTL